MKKSIIISLLILSTEFLFSQQIDGILKQKPFSLSGGLNVNQSLYFANQIEDRYVPYALVVGGNINVSIYGFSLPFSFQYTNRQSSYSTPQPFNIIGVSPSYKKLTLHAGYRNMSFSPYTLAGHGYLGGGVEYQFPKLKVMAMGGRLLKATAAPRFDDALVQTRNLPNYSRLGGGTKLEFQDKGTSLGFIVFYAQDRKSSLKILEDTINIRPEENQVYSITLKQALAKNINFNFEGAMSAWTKNQNDTARSQEKLYEYAYFLPLNQSTVFYGAIKTGLDFSIKKSKLGVALERVEPEYRTLGAYFVNNDFQNVTLNLSRPLLKNKVNFSANGGVQKDDLRNVKQTRMRRLVGSTNIGIKWSEKVNTNLTYSNFNNVINIKPVEQTLLQNSPFDRIDTLRLVQISQSAGFNLNYAIKNNDKSSNSLSLNSNFASSANENQQGRQVSNMLNAGMNFTSNYKKSKLNWGVGVNTNQNYLENGVMSFYGMSSNISKPLFKDKLNSSLGLQGNANLEDDKMVGLLYSVSNNYSITIAKRHNVGLSLRYSGRQAKAQSELSNYNTSFNEFNGSLNYGFNFSLDKDSKK